MQEHEISEVAKILSEWNPLGNDTEKVQDLDGYRTEAIDILFEIEMSNKKTNIELILMDVLNDAFDIRLTKNACSDAANKISRVLGKKH